MPQNAPLYGHVDIVSKLDALHTNDETGECTGDVSTSIWVRESRNDTVMISFRLTQDEEFGSSFLRPYEGSVTFVDASGRACGFELAVTSTYEEGSASVDRFACK